LKKIYCKKQQEKKQKTGGKNRKGYNKTCFWPKNTLTVEENILKRSKKKHA